MAVGDDWQHVALSSRIELLDTRATVTVLTTISLTPTPS
jgi:hypothetical protein